MALETDEATQRAILHRHPDVSVAAENSPTSIVLVGEPAAIDAFVSDGRRKVHLQSAYRSTTHPTVRKSI